MPLTNDFIEKEGALGDGTGLVRPAVLDATEYMEGGLIVRASRP